MPATEENEVVLDPERTNPWQAFRAFVVFMWCMQVHRDYSAVQSTLSNGRTVERYACRKCGRRLQVR